MTISEIIGIAISGFGVCFGFGIQHNRISTLRNDVNNMSKLDKETSKELHNLTVAIAEIRRDTLYLIEKVK